MALAHFSADCPVVQLNNQGFIMDSGSAIDFVRQLFCALLYAFSNAEHIDSLPYGSVHRLRESFVFLLMFAQQPLSQYSCQLNYGSIYVAPNVQVVFDGYVDWSANVLDSFGH